MTQHPGGAGLEGRSSSNDPVLPLIINYLVPARALHDIAMQAKGNIEAATDAREQNYLWKVQLSPFLVLWLAALFPVCVGFRKIGRKDPTVERIIQEMMPALRSASNATSTYTEDANFQAGKAKPMGLAVNSPKARVQRAEDLHHALENHFRDDLITLGVIDETETATIN